MVYQRSSFASELTRVAREVGTDGKLGGQAEVTGVDCPVPFTGTVTLTKN